MKEAGCGSILHDGWSQNSIHFVGLFACYKRMQDISPTIVLLVSVRSPLDDNEYICI